MTISVTSGDRFAVRAIRCSERCMTGHSIYTITLRQLVEQRADWSWAAIQIVEKQARA